MQLSNPYCDVLEVGAVDKLPVCIDSNWQSLSFPAHRLGAQSTQVSPLVAG